jgi:hypothetical protein
MGWFGFEGLEQEDTSGGAKNWCISISGILEMGNLNSF